MIIENEFLAYIIFIVSRNAGFPEILIIKNDLLNLY